MQEIKYEARPAWRNQWLLISIFIIFLLFSISATILSSEDNVSQFAWSFTFLIFLRILYRRFAWRFQIENGRATVHHGIIFRNQRSVRLTNLRAIELTQGLVQRLLGVGKVSLYTAGTDNSEVEFHGIKKPLALRGQIDRYNDAISQSVNA